MPKGPFLEIRVRLETPEQKELFERAAKAYRPVSLSLNQWMLVAALAQAEAQGVKEKKGGK